MSILPRNVNGFADRQNIREPDTLPQMAYIARRMIVRWLRYASLIAKIKSPLLQLLTGATALGCTRGSLAYIVAERVCVWRCA